MKASSLQASPSDMWIGDDFHHNGAFRLMYTFGWLAGNAVVRSRPSESRGPDQSNDSSGHFQMLVGADVFRGKYRNSFEQPEPFIPGKIARITYDLRDKYHCFRKGHRIMVHIQSTWFPLIDRNPQKFIDIYHAQESDFQKAEHTLHRSPEYSSHIKFRILK